MRRLALEFLVEELIKQKSKNIDVSKLRNIRTLEILQNLQYNEDEIAAVGRIEIIGEIENIENYIKLVLGDTTKIQLLDREKDGAYIVFVKHKLLSPPFTIGMMEIGGYVVSREIREGKLKLVLLGSAKQLKRALENLEKTTMHFNVLSLTDARFSTGSPLDALTEKQRRVITTAYELGYYSLPRKIDSEELASRLGLKRATLVVHRRKAEYRVLTALFNAPQKTEKRKNA